MACNAGGASHRWIYMMLAGVAVPVALGCVAFGMGFFDSGTPIDDAHVPDARLRAYVLDVVDRDKDGSLSREEAESVEAIGAVSGASAGTDKACLSGSISTLKGIELFPNLKTVMCAMNSDVGDACGWDRRFVEIKRVETHEEGGEAASRIVASEYDARGYLSKETLQQSEGFVRDGTVDMTSCETYERDGEGKPITSLSETVDGNAYRHTYEYDSNGFLSKEVTESENDDRRWLKEYRNDAEGRLLEYSEYRDDELQVRELYEYDASGNETSYTRTRRSGEDEAEFVRTTEYDASGNKAKMTYFYEDGTQYTYRYEHGTVEGGTFEKKYGYRADGSAAGIDESTFDQEGRLLTYVSKNGDGEVVESRSCAYDQFGNLVKDESSFASRNDLLRDSQDATAFEYVQVFSRTL